MLLLNKIYEMFNVFFVISNLCFNLLFFTHGYFLFRYSVMKLLENSHNLLAKVGVGAWWKSWSFKLNRFLYYWPSSSTTGFIKISNKASTNFLLQCIFHHHYFACFPNASLNSIRYFSIWYLLWCVQFSLFYCFTSHLRMRLNLVLKLR